jgi:hypothetical protein
MVCEEGGTQGWGVVEGACCHLSHQCLLYQLLQAPLWQHDVSWHNPLQQQQQWQQQRQQRGVGPGGSGPEPAGQQARRMQ